MKRKQMLLALLLMSLCPMASAKEVLVCQAWQNARAMECEIDDKSKSATTSIFALYKQGWRLISTLARTDRPGEYKSLFIFER